MFILLFWWGLQIVPAINKGSKSFWRDYRGTRINSRRTTECLFCLALQFWICARSIAGGPPAFPKTIFPHIWPYRPTGAIGFWGYVGLAPQACLRRVWWLWYCWVELSDIVMRACEPSFPALFSIFIMTNEKNFCFHGQCKKLRRSGAFFRISGIYDFSSKKYHNRLLLRNLCIIKITIILFIFDYAWCVWELWIFIEDGKHMFSKKHDKIAIEHLRNFVR